MEVIEYPRRRLEQLEHGPILVLRQGAVFEVAGPGALDCLQGLLTNDLVAPGANSLIYGALLTPKGMIVVDYWVARLEQSFVLVAEPSGQAASLELFRRQLPPRLARVTDQSTEWSVLWLLGERARAVMTAELGPDVPAPGRAIRLTTVDLLLAAGPRAAPFSFLLAGPPTALAELAQRLESRGMTHGTETDLRAVRAIRGWPTLGQEIDDKTLPQEVRFEENSGVSFSKGCYTGQETVARVHFRGHPNWLLRRIRFDAGTELADEVAADGKPMIRPRTVLRFEDGSGIGLAATRRELASGSSLAVAGGLLTVEAVA